ncbi:hypothetical protein KJ365_07210 [Glaciecola sp. XM2]|uniref:hypothetical protein n=1 Tax=Glaciecola sp. XM2 TaxID=1914931 RepID=UPI001BDED024|nr:hypothetical protein [Glaciecola sp. XM2]MBT1450668.1 hypothetical protein [Glaciecola sp. XM2]
MKLTSLKHYVAVAALLIVGASANASLLKLDDDGATHNIVNSNNFKNNLGASQYDIGSNVLFDVAGNFEITFTALAQESGWNNFLSAYGQSLPETPINGSITVMVNSVSIGDLLQFTFGVTSPTGKGTVSNGGNFGIGSEQSFATILNSTFNNVSYDAILLWDDSGANQDDNHDDMIVGVTISRVSAPSTLILFSFLAVVGLLRARKVAC